MMRSLLLRRCLAYFLRHGVADLSLRPLAAGVGTSARMLLHYFRSKEELVAAVLGLLQETLQEQFQRLRDQTGERKSDFILLFWRELSQKKNLAYLRLLFEIQVLALQNPKKYRRYLRESSRAWRESIEQSLPPGKERAAAATLYQAVIDGLLLELLSTGDLRRTTSALALFRTPGSPSATKGRKVRPITRRR